MSTGTPSTGTPSTGTTAARSDRAAGPVVVHTGAQLHAQRTAGRRAVVMTMGALHDGHAALVRAAREQVGEHGQVVVTVFVNPLQFGPGEDFDRYPRTLDADLRVCREAGVDLVLAPGVDEVYPEGEPEVRVSAGAMGRRLEGASRPGHFDGMLTVVAKLLHLTEADVACFGQKDAQQLALIRRMVGDLNFRCEVVGVPTVREADGVARSSRNRYLSPSQRAAAPALSQALRAGAEAVGGGPAAVRRTAQAVLDAAAGPERTEVSVHTDYLALVDPGRFTEVPDDHTGPAVLAVAARIGATRLIDNVPLVFPAAGAVRRGQA